MELGHQFLLPTEVAIEAATLLSSRFGLPYWQFTLSASAANNEAITLARMHTGKTVVLTLTGSYHGHIDATLKAVPIDKSRGARTNADYVQVPFNDIAALRGAMESLSVACVLPELAMTNANLVVPDEGYLMAVRNLCDVHGAIWVADEKHTHMCSYGGLVSLWGLRPDIWVCGKSIASGVPLGVYGFTSDLRDTLERYTRIDCWPKGGGEEEEASELHLGGTLYGNPLGLAACVATLRHVLKPEAQAHAAELGARLGDGIDRLCAAYDYRGWRFASAIEWGSHTPGRRGCATSTTLRRPRTST
jgi:glutamate-1-semialdehyde 2,1-aminomutase